MKNILLFLLIVIIGLSYGCKQEKAADKTAQKIVLNDSTKNITKLQLFLSKRGSLIVKDFYSLGSVNGIYNTKLIFTAVVIYEPGNEENRIRGLNIEVSESQSSG